MMERIAEASPRFKARIAGVFQLLEGLTATFGQVLVLGRLVVSGNAAATAANILGHERLFWLGFASSLIGVAFHIAWALLFYELFKIVNRSLSLLAAFVILVGCAIQALTILFYLAPLLVLGGGSSLSAFTAEQLQALALIFLKLNAHAFDIYLVFFGFWCVLIGYLIFRSTFLPRILGVLLAIAGLGWVTFLSPPLGIYLFPYIAGTSALGEIPLELWLIVIGVNEQRWKEQAARTRHLEAGAAAARSA
jgi:signal transduction histidine kinase